MKLRREQRYSREQTSEVEAFVEADEILQIIDLLLKIKRDMVSRGGLDFS